MKRLWIAAAVAALAAWSMPAAAETPAITGEFVEARTAEVFTGGCIMGMEGETSGREAVLAWRVTQGALEGVPLDGLSVVAVVTGDVNLGTRELGGVAPSHVNALLMVDERANADQRDALVELTRRLTSGLVDNVVAVRPTAITFAREAKEIKVAAAGTRLDVATEWSHDPNCGAVKWFDPLARVDSPTVGLTRVLAYSGDELGRHWRQVDRRSAHFGTFAIER